uniref:Uncharacterized protein n=1 Tax=Plectus sambesii TaxID=2011161 RepID=A0A914UZA7_9BILA
SVQALNRTLNTAGTAGLLLYSASGISVRALPYTLAAEPISRELLNDGNARRVAIRIDYDYSKVEKDAAVIGANWMTSIATTLGVESYRIKGSSLAAGSVVMTMTVTKPATTEVQSTAVSAEEVAAMIAEQASYGELLITDENNKVLNVYPNDTSILQLIEEPASAQSRTLVIVLGVGLGSFFVIVIVMVLIMVILKTRAEQHRRELLWSADNALLESIQSKKSRPEIIDVEQSSSSSGHSTVRFADSAESSLKRKKKRKSSSRH